MDSFASVAVSFKVMSQNAVEHIFVPFASVRQTEKIKSSKFLYSLFSRGLTEPQIAIFLSFTLGVKVPIKLSKFNHS